MYTNYHAYRHTHRPAHINEPAQLTQIHLKLVSKMDDLHSVDSDTGGYVTGEILAFDSDRGETGSLDAIAVENTLLRADQVLALVNHPENGCCLFLVTILSQTMEKPSIIFYLALPLPASVLGKIRVQNLQTKKKSPPSKTTDTTAVTGTKGPPQKTPLRKHTETAASLASKCSSNTPRNSRKVVDKTPKGRNSNNGTPMSPRNGFNGSPEATQNIMATLKEISNTLSQVVNRMDK